MRRFIPHLVILIISLAYLSGVVTVPFHPDEATQIYMSNDFELFFQHPTQLFWQPDNELDLRQKYRELDAPLTRVILGFGRWLTGTPALAADWDWSKTWEQNQAGGALPDSRTLLISRLAVMLIFPFTLWLIFHSGEAIGGTPAAWAALILTATNALILLHTRRAMAESLFLFTVTLSVWCFITLRKHPWLSGLAVALAFNAKQSAAPLIIVGAIALLWPVATRSLRRRISDLCFYTLLLIGVTFLLNPFLWNNPVQAGMAALSARSELLSRQTAEIAAQMPGQVLTTPGDRLLGLTAQLFFTLPAIADVGNYLSNTHISAQAYLSNPLNTLLRSPLGGGILLLFILSGIIMAMRNFIKQESRSLFLIFAMLLFQLLFTFVFIPLPFQRYYLPLLPALVLFAAYVFSPLSAGLLSKIKPAMHESTDLPG